MEGVAWVIQTERLRLRPIILSDLDTCAPVPADPELVRYLRNQTMSRV